MAQVWVAQFGGKVPLKVWKETFAKVLLRPMAYPIAFDKELAPPNPLHLCVFGLESGTAILDILGRACTLIAITTNHVKPRNSGSEQLPTGHMRKYPVIDSLWNQWKI